MQLVHCEQQSRSLRMSSAFWLRFLALTSTRHAANRDLQWCVHRAADEPNLSRSFDFNPREACFRQLSMVE